MSVNEDVEVKGHVGGKMSNIGLLVCYENVSFCGMCSHFFNYVSILSKLRINDPWLIQEVSR